MAWKIRAQIVIMLTVLALMLPTTQPVHAAVASIGQFYAGCSNFSVDVTVAGVNDDGTGLDRFRYLITDGNGKKLYQEDASRPVGFTAQSIVVNLPYDADGVADGLPAQNPIKFAVIDLDGNGNPGAQLDGVTYDAPCLPKTPWANRFGIFVPPQVVSGTIVSDTPFYDGPNGNRLQIIARAGATHQVLYRTADRTWVGLFFTGNDLLWVPGGAINYNTWLVTVKPTHIDGNHPLRPGSNNTPDQSSVTGLVRTDLRMRAAPALAAPIILVIPSGTTVSVLGRNANQTFLKVSYNGSTGWVSSGYVRLNGGRVSALPIVQ